VTPRSVRVSLALLVAVSLLGTSAAARADEKSCVAASENEIALRKQLKLRAALEQLAICGAPGCPAEVRVECDQRAVQLNAALPTLVLGATDAAGNDLSAVTVTLDGAPFATRLDGRALPLDPGDHALHFEAPGCVPVDKTIVAREGEKERRVSVVLGAVPPVAAAIAPSPAPTAPGPPGPVLEPTPPVSTWSSRKTLALVSAGVGVAGVGAGAVFGLMASSAWSTQQADCKSTASCTNRAGAASAHSQMETAGAVSSVAFAVGAVGLVGGIVLWLTAPSGATASASRAKWRFDPMMGPQAGGLMMSGGFQ
jgi:hypothetical protein